jgi:hypothetical protein
MLTTALLLAGMMTGETQSIVRPGLVGRHASVSAPLAKRFATLFPLEGSSTVAPAIMATDFSPRNRRADPRLFHQDGQDIICGLTVVTKSADIDPRIIVLPRNPLLVPAVRRIEPDVCRPANTGRK